MLSRVNVWLSQHRLLNRLFSALSGLGTLVSNEPSTRGFISWLSFLFHGSIGLFLYQDHTV